MKARQLIAGDDGQRRLRRSADRKKSKIEADIQSYSDQYTDKHPKMIQLRNQLAEINRHINRLEAQTAGASPLSMTPEGRDLIAMRRDLRRMEADLEVTQMRLQRRESATRRPAERRHAGRA